MTWQRSLLVALLAGVNLLAAFFYQWYIAAALGPSAATDACYAAMAIPQWIVSVVNGSLTQVLLPLFANGAREDVPTLIWLFLAWIAKIFLGLTLLLLLTSAYWTPVLFPGFGGDTQQLAIALVRIQLLGVLCTGLTSVLWAAHFAAKRFVTVEISALCANVVGLTILVLGLDHFGVMLTAWGMVIKTCLETALLFPIAGRYRKPAAGQTVHRTAWQRLKPLLLGASYYKTDLLVDRFLSSMSRVGDLTTLHLAQQIVLAANAVVGKALCVPITPDLARHAHQNDWIHYWRLVARRLLWVGGLMGLSYFLLWSIGLPLLRLLFQSQRFDLAAITQLWQMLLLLFGVWLGGALGQILAAGFYAIGETRTPTRIGVIGFTLGIALKVAGFYYAGVYGLALGTTIYYLMNAAVMYGALWRHIRRLWST